MVVIKLWSETSVSLRIIELQADEFLCLTGENGLVLACFKDLLWTLHGWSFGKENHNTLFLVDTNVSCVRGTAALSIPVSTSFEVQILVEIEGHFIISHTILSLHIP